MNSLYLDLFNNVYKLKNSCNVDLFPLTAVESEATLVTSNSPIVQ